MEGKYKVEEFESDFLGNLEKVENISCPRQKGSEICLKYWMPLKTEGCR